MVLGMKSAGVDSFMSNMLEATGLAVIETAKQAGIKLVDPELITGYGQDILASQTSLQAGQGAIFAVPQVPVELKTPATQAEQAAFSQYAHFTGVPDLNWTIGWTAADLFIKGLQAAGTTLPGHRSSVPSTISKAGMPTASYRRPRTSVWPTSVIRPRHHVLTLLN